MEQDKILYFEEVEKTTVDAAKRYKWKIEIIGGIDPYKFDKEAPNLNNIPEVTSMDIAIYMVSHCTFTKEQMKAYKSYEAGFVSFVAMKDVKNDIVVIVAKVKHSQRIEIPPLNTWIICNRDGLVRTAHCTCISGTGEACRHVGAVLFALEAMNASVNNVRSIWKGFHSGETPSKELNVQPLNNSEDLLKDLKEIEFSTSSKQIVETLADEFAIAPRLKSLYDLPLVKNAEQLRLEELIEIGKFLGTKLSQNDCDVVYESTKKQRDSEEWFHQRKGRITASNFKAACRTNINKPSISLIKNICYPFKFKFKTNATEWGIKNEQIAVQEFIKSRNLKHDGLEFFESGLCLNPSLPQFGASPDGFITCNCCGKYCIEVKCPYSAKGLTLEEYLKLKCCCLLKSNNKIVLKLDHNYYFQVQMQMKITNTSKTLFIVWTPDWIFVEEIGVSEQFWRTNSERAANFHKNVIMPELLGHYFTRELEKNV